MYDHSDSQSQRPYVDSDPNATRDYVEYIRGPARDTWMYALRQYIRTLRRPKTRSSYEERIREFFEDPRLSVERLDDLTYDDLAGYRWNLVQRAESDYTPPVEVVRPMAVALDTSTALVPMSATTTGGMGGDGGSGEAGTGRKRRRGRPRPLGRLASLTVDAKLGALRSFLCWCVRQGYLHTLTTDQINEALALMKGTRQHEPVWLDESEFLEFLDCVATPLPRNIGMRTRKQGRKVCFTGAKTWQRDVLLVGLMLRTWIRRTEARAANVGNLQCHRRPDGTEEWALVLAGDQTKGNRTGRTTPPIEIGWIHGYLDYLAATGRTLADADSPMFLTNRRKSSSKGRLVLNMINEIWQRGDLEWHRRHPDDPRHFSSHTGRRSGANAAYIGNSEVERPAMPKGLISKAMGHSREEVTDRYFAPVDAWEKQRAYRLELGEPTRTRDLKDMK